MWNLYLKHFRRQINRLVTENQDVVFNEVGVQMLQRDIHDKLFPENPHDDASETVIEAVKKHLRTFNLLGKSTRIHDHVKLDLPKLQGRNLEEHFLKISYEQIAPYTKLINEILSCSVNPLPEKWNLKPGWSKYYTDGSIETIEIPDEDVFVFDVEVFSKYNLPVIAVALSPTNWYTWCSEQLFEKSLPVNFQVSCSHLIPMECSRNADLRDRYRMIIGHNVGFDRSFIKEQYNLEQSKLRFLDTMSLHISCSGFTSAQRATFKSLSSDDNGDENVLSVYLNLLSKQKGFSKHDLPNIKWKNESSLNGLADVHKLYCANSPRISKELRMVFTSGTFEDIKTQFNELMTYCANDVLATRDILAKLYPLFLERFQNTVTLAGMLEMSTMYLPTNRNWQKYIHRSQTCYNDIKTDLQKLLMRVCKRSCSYLNENRYKTDPWLWSLNWSCQSIRLNKKSRETVSKSASDLLEFKRPSKSSLDLLKKLCNIDKLVYDEYSEQNIHIPSVVKKVCISKHYLPKRLPFMVGYPTWYRELCVKNKNNEEWAFGPVLISAKTHCTPLILRLTWSNFPLFHERKLGWGYLVPGRTLSQQTDENQKELVKKIMEITHSMEKQQIFHSSSDDQISNKMQEHIQRYDDHKVIWEMFQKNLNLEASNASLESCPFHKGLGPYVQASPEGCWFFRIPHAGGRDKNVGNPLSKTFISKVEDGTIRSDSCAELVLEMSKTMGYWENNVERISSQLSLNPETANDLEYGAILPRVVVSGTITRRAVEKTWLTASNPKVNIIGSELKAMIQAPKNYCFVGADVDTQELWIAAIYGDAKFAQIHGSTACGWMILEGNKTDKTDMHSKVAEISGISRDNAKVINYARIYGAGMKYASQLLQYFNPTISEVEAMRKTREVYTSTKGIRDKESGKWFGGSESELFNSLEEIALCEEPRTPVLGCRISRALEPRNVSNDFMTSRINWVVQSSAVDYLHLLLVCNKWLFNEMSIDGRLALSIHDEVRYLISEKDKYKAAIALQISNLFTRAMFAFKLNMHDLPASVAFFNGIDIDKCLRKETNMECITPSNPLGLSHSYKIGNGKTLNIYELLEYVKAEKLFSSRDDNCVLRVAS